MRGNKQDWQKHLAQVQQHEQQKQQQIDKTETQQPYSNNESLDDVFSSETVSGATLCESIQTDTLGENLEEGMEGTQGTGDDGTGRGRGFVKIKLLGHNLLYKFS